MRIGYPVAYMIGHRIKHGSTWNVLDDGGVHCQYIRIILEWGNYTMITLQVMSNGNNRFKLNMLLVKI